jgi:hypothetical protein
VTLFRLGGQLLDDERSCVACDAPAPAEDFQTTLPGKVEELRAKARAYADLAKRKAAEADALQAEIESAQPHAFLCGAHKAQLPPEMRGPWSPVGAWSVGMPMGGRLSDAPGSQAETDHINRTLATLTPEGAFQ